MTDCQAVTDKALTAVDRLAVKAIEFRSRARFLQETYTSDADTGFALEMARESLSALNFWFEQFEKAHRP